MQNRIRLNLTCPLIMRGNDAIVVDTGIGNRLSPVERKIFDHGDGWLMGSLKALGMEPGDITHVILSHLHFDHCGGIVQRRESGTFEAAFPRARILVQRGEIEVARDSRNERLRAAYRHIADCLGPVNDLLEPLDGDTEIVPGRLRDRLGRPHGASSIGRRSIAAAKPLSTWPTSSRRDRICAVRGIRPTTSTPFARWSRRPDYLARAVAGRWWVSFAHDDRVFAAQVKKDSRAAGFGSGAGRTGGTRRAMNSRPF